MFPIKKFRLVLGVVICLAAIYLLPAQLRAETATAAPTVMKPIVMQLKPVTPSWRRLEKPLLALDETLVRIAGARQGTLAKRERGYPERTLAWTAADGNKWRMLARTEELPQSPGTLKLIFTLDAAKDARSLLYQEQATLILVVPDTSGSVGSDSEMANLRLQDALQRQQQVIQMLSNILNAMSDTQSAIIQNMK
jgi:hypothetical protein